VGGVAYAGTNKNERKQRIAAVTNIISKIDLSRDAIIVSCFTERFFIFFFSNEIM